MAVLGRLLLRLLLLAGSCRGQENVPKRCFEPGSLEDSDRLHSEELESDCAVAQGEEATLLASLLDGSLVALGKASGVVRWRLDDEPVVKSPYDPLKPVLPAFLPDPKDGALYMMGASIKEPLQKLPFTIPQLVAASPSRTSDGILYSGKKVDTWVSVSKQTGVKKGSLSHEGCLRQAPLTGEEEEVVDMCPVMEPGTVLLGRTEYNIMMYDTRTRDRRWNITYYDYSSSLGGMDMSQDYDLTHFTDSSTGKLVTLDKVTGAVQWEVELRSPVVAMYTLAAESIAAIPFTSVSQETLENLLDQSQSQEGRESMGETKLFHTLYVGEHEHGLFAVPSLVDEKTMMISPTRETGQLLLEGNTMMQKDMDIKEGHMGQRGHSPIPKDKSSVLLFGYYKAPELSGISHSHPNQITHSQAMFPFQVDQIQMITGPSESNLTLPSPPPSSLPYDPLELSRGLAAITALNTTFLLGTDLPAFLSSQLLPCLQHSLGQVENKEMKLATLAILLTVAWFVRFVKQQFKQWEKNFGEKASNSNTNSNSVSRSSSSSATSYEVTAVPLELADGSIKVGNITFDPGAVLGKGCEGTFVYKGRFDGREVAVKRVLAACFSIADREVELLRESDEHPHVVRYFCMEQCRQFRYIALELCVATLQDWVEGRYTMAVRMEPTAVFRQAVMGLAHLHGLDIAHRDIKPQNVLLSAPGRRGEVRAMISDFGLCKKLKVGRMSFSRRSGVAGTEGWIAPEMLLGNRSTTCCVDIFSMGCVYYYMLTGGRHPFGVTFQRQANILNGAADLGLLDREQCHTQVSLIEKMLSVEPADRPPAAALLKHPVFWSKEKVLGFLQEVSDRVDKEEEGSAVLAGVERHGMQVTQGDWHELLEPAVREDLRKHRSYRGRSVRDLLRALRNKKHHYRELTESARALYGQMPGQFCDYWTTRFPRLLLHSYKAMQCCKLENNFQKYYDKDFDFVLTTARSGGDIHPGDVDLLSPPYLLPEHSEPGGYRSQDSLVSTWSQLTCDSDYSLGREEVLLPCSRDPSSEEMSEDEEGEKGVIVPPEESLKAKEVEEESLDVSNVEVPINVSEGQNDDFVSENHDDKKDNSDSVPQKLDNVSQNMDRNVQPNVEFEDEDNTGVDIVESFIREVENTSEPVDCNTKDVTKENDYVINTNDAELGKDVKSENVIHKKKNKKRRKHAKKKKPGDKTVEGDEDAEEEDAVDEEM